MKAIHVMWSAPLQYGRQLSGEISKLSIDPKTHPLADYIVLLQVLSILNWKKYNGEIKLYTDTFFAEIFDSLNIIKLYNDVNVEVLNALDATTISPTSFWAGGKFFCYFKETAPFVVLDTDLVVWKNLDEYWSCDLRFAHWEIADRKYYGAKKDLFTPPAYTFNKNWRWRYCRPANTSIVFFGNDEFKTRYATEAVRFMTNNRIPPLGAVRANSHILFTEQRLLSLCADEAGIQYAPFIDTVYDPRSDKFVTEDGLLGPWSYAALDHQPLFTHAWIYKAHLAQNQDAREWYVQKLKKIIAHNYPEQLKLLNLLKQRTSSY